MHIYQVSIDVLCGRAYVTNWDRTGDPIKDQRICRWIEKTCPPHPCEFWIEAENPEEAKRLAWDAFRGKRAIFGVIRAVIREWAWNSKWADRWLIMTGIVKGPPGQWRPPDPWFRI